MAKVRVTITGLGKDFARIQAQTIQKLSERQIFEIAKETTRVIKAKIKGSIERDGSTGNLENAFTTVKITDGYGVGDIAFLDQQAPQWSFMNYGVTKSGRKTPPRSRGAFATGNAAPQAGGGNSRWNQTSGGQFLINPTKAITPKNYIQATISEINQIISSVVRRVKL